MEVLFHEAVAFDDQILATTRDINLRPPHSTEEETNVFPGRGGTHLGIPGMIAMAEAKEVEDESQD